MPNGSRCMLLIHAGTLNGIHTRKDFVKVNCWSICMCVCYRLHLAGHADLQYTAAEEPWELSGWELVLDCALSELLSKLFPDMHTRTHTQNKTKHTHMREMREEIQLHILHTKNTKEMLQWRMIVWDDMVGADKYKMINPINLFPLWEMMAIFHWQTSVTRSHWKRKKQTFSSLSQLMAPLHQDLPL